MFERPWYDLLRFAAMHRHCPKCGLRFEVEPGFFFGAMYISYAFSMAAMLGIGFVLYYFFDNPSTWIYVTTVVIAILALLPLSFRYSRVLFLYWFGGVRYRGRQD